MAKQTRKVNTIKNGTIELVLLLLLQTNKKYGYQLAQEMSELSNGKYELKEATMYPTLYRLNQNGYLDFEQVKVGVRRVLARLFQEDIHIANWGRKFAETEFLQTEEKFIPLLFTSAAERYEVLLKNNPELLQRIPLECLATYLGITPVSLSRIRAGIGKRQG